MLGVGMVVVAAAYLLPVVAGLTLDLLIAGMSDVAVGEIGASLLSEITAGMSATLETCGQLMQFLGRNVGFFGPFSVP
jgi:hypothetical protein